MKITREQLKETIRTIMKEESDYQEFFRKALEKAGKSIADMSDDEKKEFFNKIDAAWDGKGEKNEGNAFGAAVTAAKEKGEDEFEVGGKTYKVEEGNVPKMYVTFLAVEKKVRELEAAQKAMAQLYFNEKDAKKKAALLDKLKQGTKVLQATRKNLSDIEAKYVMGLDKDAELQGEGNVNEEKYTVIDPRGNNVGAGLKIQAAAMAKKKGGEKAGYFVVPVKNALKARRALEKFKGDFKNPKLKDIMSDLFWESKSVNEGRAFINAAKKAKEEGKTEFEFNGKTYPVTIKD